MAIVEIDDLTYHYPLTTIPALRNINLRVEEGHFLGVVGPNEAGKSSLCYAISGFLKHYLMENSREMSGWPACPWRT